MIDRSSKTLNMETFSWKDLSSSNQILLSKRIVAPAPSYKQNKISNSRVSFIVHESDLQPSPVEYFLDQSLDDDEGLYPVLMNGSLCLLMLQTSSLKKTTQMAIIVVMSFPPDHFMLMLLQMKVLITKLETFF